MVSVVDADAELFLEYARVPHVDGVGASAGEIKSRCRTVQTCSQAGSINNKGSVVGFATLTGDTSLHAFLWRKGLMMDLGTLGGSDTLPVSAASNINDCEEIVGFSETATPDPLGEIFCGNSLKCLPFLLARQRDEPASNTRRQQWPSHRYNNRGQVIGFSENSTPDSTCVPPQVPPL